jgi:hypothetical protein
MRLAASGHRESSADFIGRGRLWLVGTPTYRVVALCSILALIGCRPRFEARIVDPTTGGSSALTLAEAGSQDDVPTREPASAERPLLSAAESPAPDAAPARILPTRRPRNRDEVVNITFDDLAVDMKEDQLFKPSMATDRVRQLDGQRVRIRGFLFPAIFQQTGIDKFPLVLNTECKFGPGGIAHHVILVEMVGGATTSYTMRPIAVTGRLTLKPWNGPDGNTWALYHIAGERVE